MAARIPRRSFATPFVVTFTAACSTTTQPPPTQPPPGETPTGPITTAPTDPTNQTPPTPEPKPDGISRNPPPVDNDPTHVIHRNPPDVTTPPKNPPPPPPPPPAEDRQWTVFKHGDKCEALIKIECPHGKPGEPLPTCNPPAATPYVCPPGMTDTQQLTIVTRGAICIVQPPSNSCPPNMHCNPPPQRKVPCPQ